MGINPYLPIEERKNIFLEKVKNLGMFDDLELVGEYMGSDVKTKFLCKRCNITFEARPSRISELRCCPGCRKNERLLRLSLANTNQELAGLLLNKEDGYKYTWQSTKMLKWVCPDCHNIIEKPPSNVYRGGLSCNFCGDGISYPNRFFTNLLTQLKISFIPEKAFDWGKTQHNRKYKYDFYLPKYNMIIEAMGSQHYAGNKFYYTLEEIKNNDEIKENLAKENGISKYIKIDCRYSTVDFIKESILSNELSKIIDLSNVDWVSVGALSNRSILIRCCKYYDKHKSCTQKDVAKKFGISPKTVTVYLKRGAALGMCSYTKEKSRKRVYNSIRKDIDQYTLDGQYIKTFHGAIEAENELGIKYIASSLRGKSKSVGGYVWKYSKNRR